MREQPDHALGAAVKRLREEQKLTQEKLAFGAEITVSSLSRIERGCTDPGWTTVGRIAKALGVGIAELE